MEKWYSAVSQPTGSGGGAAAAAPLFKDFWVVVMVVAFWAKFQVPG